MRTCKHAIIIIVFLLPAAFFRAQAQVNQQFEDSLSAVLEGDISEEERATTLVLLGKHFRQSDTDRATALLDEAIALSKNLGKDNIMADAYYQKGVVQKYTGQPDLKFQYFSIAGTTYLDLGDTLWYCRSAYEMGKYFIYDRLNLDTATYLLEQAYRWVDKGELLDVSLYSISLADVYSYGDKYYESIETYKRAIEALQQRGDTANWASCLQKLGNVHYYLGEYDKMVQLINESNVLIKRIEQDSWTEQFLSNNYMNMSIVLLENDKLDEATPFLFKADSMARNMGEIDPYLDNTMAEYHYRKGNIDSAYFRFQRAITYTRADKDLYRLPVLLNGLGELHLDQKRYNSALSTLLESTRIAKETNQPNTYSNGLESLAKTYAALGRHKQAYQYYTKYHALSDSLLNEDKIKELTTLENQYAFEEEKEEIAQKQREKELLLQSEIQRKEFIQYGLFAGIGAVALLAIVFYRYYRSKQRDNVKITQQGEELRKRHEEMAELSNYKQGLTHMIAHDMKNPLNVIIAMTQREVDEESWKEVGQSGKMILQMVNNMLDIQRFEETSMNLKLESHYLSDLVNRAKYQVELLMIAKSIKFENMVDPDLVVRGDADILVRIFVNLYTNAIKYMQVGGRLTINSSKESGKISISVADTGKGIEKEFQKHVFEKFWQSDPKKFGMSTSNGLGLTFCKLAVLAHGGNIDVQSVIGKGSVFTFDLEEGEKAEKAAPLPEFPQDESNMTAEELKLVRELSRKLRNIPIYKSSKIEEVLQTIDSNQSAAIGNWKQKLREASFSFDNEAFEILTDY